jgi:hypothetical protein
MPFHFHLNSPLVHKPVVPAGNVGPETSEIAYAEPIAPTSASTEETVVRLVALVDHLSVEVGMLQSQVAVLKTDAYLAREESESLRASLSDLEAIVMRELIVEAPLEKKKKEKKKTTSTTQGEVLSRQNRHSRKPFHRGAISEDESTSS